MWCCMTESLFCPFISKTLIYLFLNVLNPDKFVITCAKFCPRLPLTNYIEELPNISAISSRISKMYHRILICVHHEHLGILDRTPFFHHKLRLAFDRCLIYWYSGHSPTPWVLFSACLRLLLPAGGKLDSFILPEYNIG